MESKTDKDDFTNVERFAAECPVVAVTVFQDRAEVTRRVTFKAESAGKFLVDMKHVTPDMDEDTVRVKGRGRFTILDISTTEAEAPKVVKTLEDRMAEIASRYEDESEEIAGARDAVALASLEVKRVTTELDAVAQTASRIQEELTAATAYANNFVALGGGSRGADGLKHVLPKGDDFLAFVESNGAKLEALEREALELTIQRRGIEKAKTKANEALAEAREHLAKLETEAARAKSAQGAAKADIEDKDEKRWRDGCQNISVGLLVAAPDEDIELFVLYTVEGPSWAPSYDVRADSSNDLKLTYYGSVRQETGETWADCELSLSTSAPAIGGTPPDLPGLEVTEDLGAYDYTISVKSKGISHRARTAARSSAVEAATRTPAALVSEADVKATGMGGGMGTTFVIPARTTIKCDNTPRKVTVATLPMRMEVTHYAVPAASTHAYLKARVTNSSDFPLLPSKTVLVFFDEAFVAKSKLDLVSPGEHFDVYLGTDPSVRVTFKGPIAKATTVGLLTTSNVITRTTHTQILNARRTPVKILLRQQLPSSTNADIKVSLKQPSPREFIAEKDFDSEKFVPGIVRKHEAESIVEWYVEIQAGKSRDVDFVFDVEYPAGGRAIEFV